LISRVYKTENNPDKVLEFLKLSSTKSSDEEAEKLSLKQVLFDKIYRRATWTVFIMTIWN
jgi:hypothetical protein